MMQKTFEVTHEGTHYPTEAQMRAALRDALKADDVKSSGEPEFVVVENTSGGPSKVRATFDVADDAPAAKAAPKK